MAPLAGVEVRRGGELSVVFVAVAIRAFLKLDLEPRIFPLRDMTLITLQFGVSSLQWIVSRHVLV